MRMSVFITSTVLFASGCSSSHKVALDQEIRILHGTIVLADTSEMYAREINIGNDSTVVVVDESNKERTFPNSGIQSIHTTNHAAGAFEGLALGILGGGAVGYGYESMLDQGDAKARTAVGILGAMAGGTIGVVIGLVSGHTESYRFPRDSVSTPGRSTELE